MPVPKLKAISAEDFQDAPEWFRKFIETLNPFLTDVTNLLTGRLTAENLQRQVSTITVVTAASVPDTFANSRVRVKNKLAAKPIEVRIGQIVPKSQGDTLTAAVGLTWDYLQTGEIRIKGMPGLNASKTYDVTLVIE